MPRGEPDLGRFCACEYQILDADFESLREVAILSGDALTPRIGDLFTVETRGVVHEVAVVQLATFERGWGAICRVTDVF